MQPKNKFQRAILKLSQELPVISEKQKLWAYDHCLDHVAKLMKRGIVCLDCGHTWKDNNPKSKKTICPGCHRTVEIQRTTSRVFKDNVYFGITTTWKGNQVFRLFFLKVKYQASRKPEFDCFEVVQRWIGPDGKNATLAKSRSSFSPYYDAWLIYSEMELRKKGHIAFEIKPYRTYPAARYLPQIKRNGFKGEFYGIIPFEFYSLLLSSNIAETLLKLGEIEWLQYTNDHLKQVTKCWTAIKISLRHKKIIKDKSLWLDYVELLLYFGKDIHNPQVIFPINLHKEHDRLMTKKRKIQRLQEFEKKKEEINAQEEKYKKSKGKYFGVSFTDGLLKVQVIGSVREVAEEGDVLRHCIFTNNYHKKSESLLLSARIDGSRIETIELSTKTWNILQCRGKLNQNSEYHDRILKLVNDNMNLFREHIAKKKSRKNGSIIINTQNLMYGENAG